MTERVVAIDHPIGHAHHIPVEPNCFERIIARTTLNMRSVNVVIINPVSYTHLTLPTIA